MSEVVAQELPTKRQILDREIEKMLRNPNPFEGVYAMYGDHPDPDDEVLQSRQLARLTNVNA